MELQPIINRFYIKYFPEMLNVKDENEKTRVINNYLLSIQDDFEKTLEETAVNFFKENNINIPNEILLSILFGVGENRFLHLDSDFIYKPFSQVSNVYEMVLLSHSSKKEIAEAHNIELNKPDNTKNFTFFCLGCIYNIYLPFSFTSLSRRVFFMIKESLMSYASDKLEKDDMDDKLFGNKIIVEALDICQKYADIIADDYKESGLILEAYTSFDILDSNTLIRLPSEFNIIFTDKEDTKKISLENWYSDLISMNPISFYDVEISVDDILPLVFEDYDQLYARYCQDQGRYPGNVVKINFGKK